MGSVQVAGSFSSNGTDCPVGRLSGLVVLEISGLVQPTSPTSEIDESATVMIRPLEVFNTRSYFLSCVRAPLLLETGNS